MKKNIKQPLKLFAGCIMGLSLLLWNTSCEDYLEDELLSDTSVDFLYTTPVGLESAVVGLYSLNRNLYEQSFWNGAIPLILQSKSDLAFGRGGEISLFSRLAWGAILDDTGTRGGYDFYWTHYYKLADRSNAIITAAENLEGIDEGQRNKIIAEAKCMRANSYFTLYRLFNNIFITTEPTTPDNAFEKPQDRSSEAEIFELLNSDLEFAISNLDMASTEFGRWTQASARHLKAKVAAWQEDWSEAADQADAVISDGTYGLLGNTADVFQGDMNHSETLFAIQYQRDAVGGGRRNFMNWQTVANYAVAPGMVYSLNNGGNGAGFVMLNDYVRGLLSEDPNDNRDDGTYYISYYTYNNAESLPDGAQVGDTLDLYDQYSDSQDEFTNYYRQMNPGVLKFLDETADPSDRNHISNIMIYRLAETYLIGAEAHLELGNTAKALEYINAIRNRANATSLTEIDMQDVLDERARELAFEGQRWYTLKRRGLLIEYLRDHMGNDNYNQTYGTGDPRALIQEHMKNWPIPQAQKELLGPNYPQNEGY